MQLVLGADHRGFPLKEMLKGWLMEQDHTIDDVGASVLDEEDDYSDFGAMVAQAVAANPGARGVVICGSGAGIAIAANRIRGARAVLTTNLDLLRAARRDDDVNILALPADFVDADVAKALVAVFLDTPFARSDRFLRRIRKFDA